MFLYCIISRLVAHASQEDRIKRTRRTGAEHDFEKRKQGGAAERAAQRGAGWPSVNRTADEQAKLH